MSGLFGNHVFKGEIKRGYRRRLISAAEICFAAALRLIPRRYRFEAAAFIACNAAPLFSWTAAYKQQLTTKVDGPNEITLHFILNALTKNNTRFDPVIVVKGYEEFKRAYATGRGVLVIGPHAALNLLLIRLFHEDGYEPVVISPDPQMHVGGTTVTVRTIQPSPTFLIKTRNRLRHGEVVCAMPDRAEHHAKRTVEFDTANGPVIFAPALIEVAARCRAQVVFTEVHLEGRQLVGTIAAPSHGRAGSVDSLTEDFMKFVQCHVEARFFSHIQKRKANSTITLSPQICKTREGSEKDGSPHPLLATPIEEQKKMKQSDHGGYHGEAAIL